MVIETGTALSNFGVTSRSIRYQMKNGSPIDEGSKIRNIRDTRYTAYPIIVFKKGLHICMFIYLGNQNWQHYCQKNQAYDEIRKNHDYFLMRD